MMSLPALLLDPVEGTEALGVAPGQQDQRDHQGEKEVLDTASSLLLPCFAWGRLCPDPGFLEF